MAGRDWVFHKGQVFKPHGGVEPETQTDLSWGMTGSAFRDNDGFIVEVLDHPRVKS
jgi:hypothetical protein